MSLSQSHFRFGSVDGTEATHGWLAGIDRFVNRLPGSEGAFLLRFCVQADATGLNNVDLEVQYRLNGGTWTDVTTSSSVVRTGANAIFSNNDDCTQRLTGTGTFVSNNNGCTTDGSAGGTVNDIAANGNTEVLIGLQIINADTNVGDIIEFRLTRDGGTLLDTYDVTPTVYVATEILAIASQDNSLHYSQSAGVNKIRNTTVAVEAIGMSSSDLADNTLQIDTNVYGTTVVGSTDPADYTVHLYGPDVWLGGSTGKDGLPVKPNFSFAQDIPEGVKRVLASFQPNKTATFGFQATIIE